ncbi:hypothetical protein [Pseudonocardia sp. ICBG1293]|uniref:hypothetical protein n=1 Tax=Pseudonocardia sp. ICBG1293 TaxID=2844382 RepID=UPI0027E01456|nr:hypothetical protein [Pseudonocardia sp. ICBG1293]
MLALRDAGRPLPGRVVAFSPWLDMENTGSTLSANAATDALVTVPLLEGMIAGVLGRAGSTRGPRWRTRCTPTSPGSRRST